MPNNRELLNQLNSMNEDIDLRGEIDPHGVVKAEARERTRLEQLKKRVRKTKVKTIHNLSNNTIERIEIFDE